MSSEMKFFLSVLAILGGAFTLYGFLVLVLSIEIPGSGLAPMSLGLALLACSVAFAQYKTQDIATYSPILTGISLAYLVVNVVWLLTSASLRGFQKQRQ